MATAFPIAPISGTTSSTASPTTTTSITQSSTGVSGTSDKGAIIGGAVGGAAGLVVITMLLAWLWITRRRDGQRHTRSPEDSWYEKTRHSQATNVTNVHAAPALAHRPPDPPNDAHPERASQSNLTESLSNPSMHAQRPERTFRVTNDTVPSSPVQTSGPTQPSPSALPTSARQDGPSTDINVLARQVAAVMMQNTLDAGAGGSPGTNPRDNSSVRSEPPDYVVHR